MKRLSTLLPFALGLLLFAACANDDTTKDGKQEQEPGTEGLTSFVMGDDDEATRTTGEYDGSGINFFWTAGDRLWVNAGTATSPNLKQDAKNTISNLLTNSPITGGVSRTAKASFLFDGTYTAASYPVRYTGKGNTKGDQVTIKGQQAQIFPNDASHIGEDGDCGIATATKNGNKYQFTLDHAAAYATFLPYTSQGEVSGAKIWKIKVSADQTICGQFNFSDNGIDPYNSTSVYTKSIELALTTNTGSFFNESGFSIPTVATAATNAAIMVIAPGSYTNLTVEYTLHDPITRVTGTITTQYPGTVTFTAGKNKKISHDLQVTVYPSNGYYMWDAQQQYWYGHESDQPTIPYTSAPAGSWPQNNSDSRWFNETQGYSDGTGAAPAVLPTTTHFKALPNVNELRWYAERGDPHWDNSTLWATMGHLYVGGMWLKKKSQISGYSPEHAPNGIDYTQSTSYTSYQKTSMIHNKPTASVLNNYFYLPALGSYNSGMLIGIGSGFTGSYWSSTPYPSRTDLAYYLQIQSNNLIVNGGNRNSGMRLWTAQ